MSCQLRLTSLVAVLFMATVPLAGAQEPNPPASSRRPARPPDRPTQPVPSTPTDESTPAEPAPPADTPEKTPFSLFGDTARFGRLGGWGGIGGAMGQFGMGPSMLIMTPAVQKELDLTDDQLQALRDWSQQMREKGREIGQSMRDQSEANMRQMNIPAAMRMMGQLNTLLQQNEQGIRRILTKAQWTRLQQIGLQMQGVTALTRPDVAQALVLAPEQYEKIQTLTAQTQLRQVGYWMQQGIAMRQRAEAARNRPSAAQEPARARVGDAEKKPIDESSSDPDRQRRRDEMRNQFDTLRDGADRIQQETVDQILRILTKRQRAKFERLLGPPFDPDSLTQGWERPRPNSESTENQSPGQPTGTTPGRAVDDADDT